MVETTTSFELQLYQHLHHSKTRYPVFIFVSEAGITGPIRSIDATNPSKLGHGFHQQILDFLSRSAFPRFPSHARSAPQILDPDPSSSCIHMLRISYSISSVANSLFNLARIQRLHAFYDRNDQQDWLKLTICFYCHFGFIFRVNCLSSS